MGDDVYHATGAVTADLQEWDRLHVEVWIRNAGGGVTLSATVLTSDSATRTIHLLAGGGTDYPSGNDLYCYSASSYNDGQCRYVEMDLSARSRALTGNDVLELQTLNFNGSDYDTWKLILSSGNLQRTWQMGLGSLTGPLGADNTTAWTKTYYHHNDLGTVQVQTNSSGAKTGLWEPDGFGNYGYAASGSPARPDLGMTCKMYDPEAGLYYFGARWLDPERGRWMNEEPLGIDGPNLYHFGFDDPLNGFDPNGLDWFSDIWDLPGDLLGGLVGFVQAPISAAISLINGRPSFSITINMDGSYYERYENCILVPLGGLTIGHSQFFPPWASSSSFAVPRYDLSFKQIDWERVGDHENRHLPQWERLGPVYPIVYGAGMIDALIGLHLE